MDEGFELFQRRIKSFAQSSLAPEHRDDFVQEAALMALEGRRLDLPPKYYHADYLRSLFGRTPASFVENSVEMGHDPSIGVEGELLIHQMLKTLDPVERIYICFFFFEEMSLKEIGSIFKVTASSVSQRLDAILSKLRTKFS